MKGFLLWSFCVIVTAAGAEPPIPAFGATSFLPLITLNQPEIFPPSGSNPLSNTLIYQQFGGNAGTNPGGGLQQAPTPNSPFASNPTTNLGGFDPQASTNTQQQQPQQFSDSTQEDAPAASNDTPSNEGVETANESLQQQSTNNAGQQKLATTRFLPTQGGSFSQVATPDQNGFSQSPNQFGQQGTGNQQQQRPQYFGPTSNSIDGIAQNTQQQQGVPQYFGPQQQQQQQGQNFGTPQTGFAQQQTGGGQQTQGFAQQQGQFAPQIQPGFGGQQQQPQGSGSLQPQGPIFGQGFQQQQGQGQPQGPGFSPQQPQGFASQQQGVVSQQNPSFDAQQQNDGPEIQNQGLTRGNQGGQQNGAFPNNANPSSQSNLGQQPLTGNQANNLGQTDFQGQQNPQPAFPRQQNPQPAFPRQQNPQTGFPGQQNPQPAFPAQQNPQPAFPAQQNPQPTFPRQQNPQSGVFQPQNPNQNSGQTPGQNVGQPPVVNPGLGGRNPQGGAPRVVPNGGAAQQPQVSPPRGNQVVGAQGQGAFPNDNVVKGQYRVGLPDGRTQIVRYIALVTYTDSSDPASAARTRPVGSASNKRGILASLDGQTIEDDSSSEGFSQKRKRSDFQEISVPLKSPFGLRLAKIIKRRLKMAEKEKHKEA